MTSLLAMDLIVVAGILTFLLALRKMAEWKKANQILPPPATVGPEVVIVHSVSS